MTLPDYFVWTRYGTESGESVESILARKERERQASGGIFLWGIGNSVGPAMRRLVHMGGVPLVVFSPMRSKPKAIDVAPSRVVRWTRALDMDGHDWTIPSAVRVLSRAGSEGSGDKRSHYALVCRSTQPLKGVEIGNLACDRLVNLLSGSKLGASQVTSVVQHLGDAAGGQILYPITLVAELTFPYFVRLEDPIDPLGADPEPAARRRNARQAALFPS